MKDPIGYLITRWRQDPHSLGSYSFLSTDASNDDRKLLGTPVEDRLFFAGEATSYCYPSTVHGALYSGKRAAAEVETTNAQSVAVIGAGFAGLSAARQLAASNKDVTVLEARKRIGGRVWTDRSLGVPVDLGASWIHGITDNPLTDIANSADIKWMMTDYHNSIARNSQGSVLEKLPEECEVVITIEHEYAADAKNLSPHAPDEGNSYYGGDAVIPGGYDQLLPDLAGSYKTVLSSTVTAVDYSNTAGVIVTTDETDTVYDAVIVTVPLGVLKAGTIAFTPALPAANQAGINRLGMGLLNKVCLHFDEVFWDAEADLIHYAGNPCDWFAEWVNLYKYTGEPVLVAYNAASAAEKISTLSDKTIIAEAMQVLRSMYR